MADRPKLTVVGKGEPEPDTRLADALKEALAKVEAGEAAGAFVLLDTLDGDPELWCAGDDPLRLTALAEVLLPAVKAAALGLE